MTIREATSAPLRLPNSSGLHARPAAVLVGLAANFEAEVQVRLGAESADAKSILEILMLGATHGSTVVVTASGPDAEAAVATISQAILDGLGEGSASPDPLLDPPA